MQVTIEAGVILMGVINALFAIIGVFGMLWIRNVQASLKTSVEIHDRMQREFAAFRESVAREYVPRAEQRDLREEMRITLDSIDRKLTDITNKLDRKQDKP